MTPCDEYITALDIAVVTLHWVSRAEAFVRPGVSIQLRLIADSLAFKLKQAKAESFKQLD